MSNDAVDADEEGAPVGVEAPERLSCMLVGVELGIANTLATSRWLDDRDDSRRCICHR